MNAAEMRSSVERLIVACSPPPRSIPPPTLRASIGPLVGGSATAAESRWSC